MDPLVFPLHDFSLRHCLQGNKILIFFSGHKTSYSIFVENLKNPNKMRMADKSKVDSTYE